MSLPPHTLDSVLLYPCRCLCRGLLLQMMYTLPFRLTLMQCIHIFLTADRTFMPRIWIPAMDVDRGRAWDWEERIDGIGWRMGRCWRIGRIRARNMIEIGH